MAEVRTATGQPSSVRIPHDDLGECWRRARSSSRILNLDVARANQASDAVLSAMREHHEREQQIGGYRAEAEAAPRITSGRKIICRLLGLPGDEPHATVGYVENGTSAIAALLAACRLPQGARVGVLRSDYGSNTMVLQVNSRERGWNLVKLACDELSRLRIDSLQQELSRGLDMVSFPPVASQRGIVQPTEEAARLCSAAGVPLILDVCQALGQVDCSRFQAAAYGFTARKWLAGPRGVGGVAVHPDWVDRLIPNAPDLEGHRWGTDLPVPLPGAVRFESSEAAIAARVGFAVALQEFEQFGAHRYRERVHALAAFTRQVLAEVPGWQVVEPVDEPSGITTLLPGAGKDVFATAARLEGDGIVLSAVPVSRSPGDLKSPVLRVSTGAGATQEDIHRLFQALTAI